MSRRDGAIVAWHEVPGTGATPGVPSRRVRSDSCRCAQPSDCTAWPCIRDMRIRVKDVLDLLAAGVSEKEILEDYPDLEAEDIKACLQYAAAQADHAVLKVP